MVKEIFFSEIKHECYRARCEGFNNDVKTGHFRRRLAKPPDINYRVSLTIYYAHMSIFEY